MKGRLLAGLVALLPAPVIAAGGSYLVDDAGTVDAGRCQLEAWFTAVRADANGSTWVPACHVLGVEWSLVLGFERGGRRLDESGLGIKRAWTLSERLAIGAAAAGSRVGSRHEQTDVYVPLTFDVRGDGAILLHGNAGTRHRRDDRWRSVAGVGADVALATSWRALLEGYVVDGAETVVQGGLRWLPADALSFDLVAGRERDAGDRARWLTFGVNIVF